MPSISLSLPLPPGKNITNRAGVNRQTGQVYKPGAKLKNEYKQLVRLVAAQAGVRGVGMPEGKLELVVRWYFARRSQDGDGPLATLQDAIAEAVGFNDKQIRHWDIRAEDRPKDVPPHVEVEVRAWNEDWPRPHISVEPCMMYGEPSIFGHRLEAIQFAEIWWSGNWAMEDILASWQIGRTDVLLCCWYEARYGTLKWRKRWGEWLEQWEEAFWHSDYDNIPLPPQAGKD